jgi:hypothetical protein
MPMPNQYLGGTAVSPAGVDLGFGGDLLGRQVKDEAEETRRKRMLEEQQRRMGPAAGQMSPATMLLFGGGTLGRMPIR